MRHPFWTAAAVTAFALAGALPGRASAAEPTATVPAAPAQAMTPESLLAAADAAVDAGNLDLARSLYQQIVSGHPQVPEANEARRALKILAARARQIPPGNAASPGGDGVVIRNEPYSLRTSERLRLTTWEKLDFGTTAFLYGLSIGFSYSLSLDNPGTGDALPPIAIGALAYTLGAVAFLKLADPDRGDLPLALAITSYIPTTTLLVADAAFDNPSSKRVAAATVVAGVVSIPIAVIAAKELDLDPGDTQLVRDAGFWGLVLGTTGTLAFGGSTITLGGGFSEYQSPTTRAVSVAGLVGLYGGLGLGLAGAHFSNVSLERVRVTTWGGYGGAVVGLLVGAAAGNSTPAAYRGLSIGALLGLAVTFLSTSGLDGIPPEEGPAQRPAFRITPTMQPVIGFDGQPHPALGLSGTLF